MHILLYESLVKECLEATVHFVYNNLRVPTKQEIETFAFSPKKDEIIGEVLGSNPNTSKMEEILLNATESKIGDFIL